jgi:hypothetical protein
VLPGGPTPCVVTAAAAAKAGGTAKQGFGGNTGRGPSAAAAEGRLVADWPRCLPPPPSLQGAIRSLLVVVLLLPMACLPSMVPTDLPSPPTLQGAINCRLLGVPLFCGPLKVAVMLALVLGCLLRGRAVSGHCVA